jgi:hypothetical protein
MARHIMSDKFFALQRNAPEPVALQQCRDIDQS